MGDAWSDDSYSGVGWGEIDKEERIHLISKSKSGSWILFVSQTIGEAVSPGTIDTANNFAQFLLATLILGEKFRGKWGDTSNSTMPQKLDYLKKGIGHVLPVDSTLKDDVVALLSKTNQPTGEFGTSDRETDQPNASREMFEAIHEFVQQIDVREFESDDSTIYSDVFGFLPDSELFLGTRKHWKEGEAALSPNDTVSGALLQWLFIELNTKVTEGLPIEMTATSSSVDFSRNLVSFGGPIPNDFSRNLLYDSDISFPYRYCLNPEPEIKDLSSHSPAELRELGRLRKDDFDRPPNWYIADATENPLVVQGEEARPVSGDDRWLTDYFMITKTPNVHPRASPGTKCLSISGCHGFGTWGATRAIQIPENIRQIHEEVWTGDFQAIGRVTRTVQYNPDGSVNVEEHDPEIIEVVAL